MRYTNKKLVMNLIEKMQRENSEMLKRLLEVIQKNVQNHDIHGLDDSFVNRNFPKTEVEERNLLEHIFFWNERSLGENAVLFSICVYEYLHTLKV